MGKQLLYGSEGRQKLAAGFGRLAAAMRTTLGPTGRHVLLEKKFGAPQSTKDGLTISKEIELADPFENMGAKLLNEVASKTHDVAGDGATTAVMLAQSMLDEGARALTAGVNPVDLKRGMDAAAEAAVGAIRKISRPVSGRADYERVALVASGNDPILGKLVADAMEKVGREGVITVEEGKSRETVLELADGLQFDKGYISPYFITKPEDMIAEFEDVYVLLSEKKIASVQEFVPILEKAAQTGRPLLVVAEEVEGDALAALVVNRLRGVLRVCAVKAPAFGDRRKAILEDMAILTGARVLSDESGLLLEKLNLADLGRVKKAVVEKERTTLIGGGGKPEAIRQRVEQIRTQIKATTSDYDREKLQERLAKLQGGVAICKVGALTEAELKDRKARAESAVRAVRAAAEEGIVPGGGVALLRAISAVKKLSLSGDERVGADIVARALRAPLSSIAANAGHDGAVAVAEVLELSASEGFDAETGEYRDLVKAGIVDPTQVVRVALQNAESVVSLVLTSAALVVELKDKKKKVAGAVK